MKKAVVPKYAHLEYRVLHELDISITEYFLLDMVYRLSRSGWCNKKLENIAFDMRLSRRAVIDNRNRLIERKLLIKGIGNRLKTSEKVQKVYLLDESELIKSADSSKKVQMLHLESADNVSKTDTRLTNRITKSNKVFNFKKEWLKHKGIT